VGRNAPTACPFPTPSSRSWHLDEKSLASIGKASGQDATQTRRHNTESPSRRRKPGIPRFRSGPLPKMNHFHLNPAQMFVTTTESLRKKWQLIFPIHHISSLFARDHLLLNKTSYPPYAIAETVIVSNYATKRQHPRSSPVLTHPRRHPTAPQGTARLPGRAADGASHRAARRPPR
jgi:hypothetical protein